MTKSLEIPVFFRRVTALLLAFVALSLPAVAFAKGNARVVEGRGWQSGQAYLVSFRVEGAFTPDMEEAIRSGIPTSFTYFFRVFRYVPGWIDENVFEFQVRRTVHYDNIRDTFTVLLGEKGETITVKNFNEAKSLMTAFNEMPVSVLSAFSREDAYYIKVKAQMEKIDIPFPFGLDFLFFFTTIWDFETSWTRIELKPASARQTPAPSPAPAEGAAP
ncbi:MAG: DUF4390 domain-containing protein [Deltaproteobacteria bacterium]|nr:DUF4390 domain-containing protein [Deltaproteobacteria bacterium]